MNTFISRYGDWALITGASKGIGLEISGQIAARGLSVVLVARSEERLEPLARSITADYPVKATIVVADLTDPAGMTRLLEATSDLDIGLLVNNAGREDSGPFLQIPLECAGTGKQNSVLHRQVSATETVEHNRIRPCVS